MSRKSSNLNQYSKDEKATGALLAFGVPILLLILFFAFYNHFQFNVKEMIKTTGLLAIALLSLTLAIGPLSRILSFFEGLKTYRKIWGILSFLIALTHGVLVYIFFFHYDLHKFIDTSNTKFEGILSGLLALIILFLLTLTSNQKAINYLGPKVWKIIQTVSYIALVLAVLHFYVMESTNGVLVIKRLLGRITFWSALAVVIIRILVQFLPARKK